MMKGSPGKAILIILWQTSFSPKNYEKFFRNINMIKTDFNKKDSTNMKCQKKLGWKLILLSFAYFLDEVHQFLVHPMDDLSRKI